VGARCKEQSRGAAKERGKGVFFRPKPGLANFHSRFPRLAPWAAISRCSAAISGLFHQYKIDRRSVGECPKKFLATTPSLTQNYCFGGTSICDWPAFDFFTMKAKIIVTPKKAVLDPQGKTVQTALEHMGYRGVKAVHMGKYLEIELDGTDKEAARQQLNEAAHKFLSNPVIEDYKLEIE
jgi:phosphoribosylformylglycinamidine synthase PurS subunit